MNNLVYDLLSLCKTLAFGKVNLDEDEALFYQNLNKQIIHLCKSLPKSMRTKAILFIMEYAGRTIGEPIEFFNKFHTPVWSIINRITKSDLSCRKLTLDEYEHACRAQAMALFLHSLDDHLNDRQIPASHLLLLLRTQAWSLMKDAVKHYACEVPGGMELTESLINDYYTGICPDIEPQTLEDYCELFRKQIATWLIIPMLASKKLTYNLDFMKDMQKAFESFAIAWRLIDDINDLEVDLYNGDHTSVYLALPQNGRDIWNTMNNSYRRGKDKIVIMEEICCILSEQMTIEYIIHKTCHELDIASAYADRYGMNELSDQYQELGKPLKLWLKDA